MNRVLVQIGPITVYWYSFLILVAVIVGYQIVVSYSRKISYKTNEIMDMVLYLVIFSIIGARAYYVIFNFSLYQDDLLSIFMIWKGGLAIYGGVIAGILYILYYCKKKNLNFLRVLDIYSLSLLLGQAIGRCDYENRNWTRDYTFDYAFGNMVYFSFKCITGSSCFPYFGTDVYNISAFFGVRHTTVIFTTFAIDYTFHLVIREVDRTY